MRIRGNACYLDSSALVRLAADEAKSSALRVALGNYPVRLTSRLATVEVPRSRLNSWVWIDTQGWTCHDRCMPMRTKRTYNLAPATVRRVREMAEEYGVAPSQDAVIELAVDELERRLRDERESAAWEEAASDPDFQAEGEELDSAYRSADRETWPV